MKQIPLTQNQFALVDDELFDYLNQWRWYYNDGYACRKQDGKHLQMHRVILKTKRFVDHKNGNSLDNRKENLRFTNHSLNAMNMKIHHGKAYKGITKYKKHWRVQIWRDNKRVFSATAPTERWAAMIYDLNAAALFGEYARLNFSPVGKTADAPL